MRHLKGRDPRAIAALCGHATHKHEPASVNDNGKLGFHHVAATVGAGWVWLAERCVCRRRDVAHLCGQHGVRPNVARLAAHAGLSACRAWRESLIADVIGRAHVAWRAYEPGKARVRCTQ